VPEQPALYDWMTVAEIGWFASGFHADARSGTDAYRTRYTALVEGFGLPAGRRLRHLSKGGRAKVSLALALASEPELLILDEPTSGLDVLVRREFLESLVDLAGAGPDRADVEPPDRRGRAGGQPRRADPPGVG
jgi:ABC-2 type transport system ATP-binding protein